VKIRWLEGGKGEAGMEREGICVRVAPGWGDVGRARVYEGQCR
jgi:hypothetical protein